MRLIKSPMPRRNCAEGAKADRDETMMFTGSSVGTRAKYYNECDANRVLMQQTYFNYFWERSDCDQPHVQSLDPM